MVPQGRPLAGAEGVSLHSVGRPRPPSGAGWASSAPGHGGQVKQRKVRARGPAANWKCHLGGMASASPGPTSTGNARSGSLPGGLRQTLPVPLSTYQSSSTPRCQTGLERCRASRVTSQREALSAAWAVPSSRRISDPSGARVSGFLPLRPTGGTRLSAFTLRPPNRNPPGSLCREQSPRDALATVTAAHPWGSACPPCNLRAGPAMSGAQGDRLTTVCQLPGHLGNGSVSLASACHSLMEAPRLVLSPHRLFT